MENCINWYVNWFKIKGKLVSLNDYNKIIKIARSVPGLIELNKSRTDPLALGVSIAFENTSTWNEIRLSVEEGFFRFLFKPNSNCEDILTNVEDIKGLLNAYKGFKDLNTKAADNNAAMSGRKAYMAVNRRFKQAYNKSIEEVFSGNQYKELYKEIKNCIPSPVNFCDELAMGKILNGVSSADISSAYPYQLSQDMPTLHGCIFQPGRIKPDEQYPFAFYIKSHHMAIYNEFDTSEFAQYHYIYPSYYDSLAKWQPDDNIKEDEEITILCKRSDYSFEEIVKKLYNGRNKHPKYKDYLNLCTGYFALNKNPILSHLLAVIRARHAMRMFKLYDLLFEEGMTPIMICTDAIIWQGGKSKYSTDIKKLGAFVNKFENAEIAVGGVKKYQIKLGDDMLTMWAGNKNKDLAEFGDVLSDEAVLEEYEYMRLKDNTLIYKNKGRIN